MIKKRDSLNVGMSISCRSRNTRKTFWCYFLLTPQIIGVLLFSLYPTFWAAQKAFYFYNAVPSETRFVGLENFIRVFTSDTAYWNAWKNTFIFAVGKLPLELPLAMIVALCLNRKIKGKGFFRAMYYLPSVIGAAVIGVMITNLFDYFGFINALLMKCNIIKEPIAWFSEPSTAMIALIFGAVWNTFGVNVLYFMAAMSNISESLYESAKIDGASEWTTFWKITLPLMAPVLQVILLLSINGTVHTCDYILTTTNGGPAGSTYTVMAYQVGKFVPGFADAVVNIGYGCAMSIITSIFMIIIAIVYLKLSKKMQSIY